MTMTRQPLLASFPRAPGAVAAQAGCARLPAAAAVLATAAFAVLLATATTARAADADDPFVLPGRYSEATTVAELQALFGAGNVRIVEAAGADGGRSVVLFADDPTRRAYVEFHDDATLEGVRSIAVRDAGSRWRGKGGVHVGMGFAALRAANGKAFGFAGFDAQGRGAAHDQWSIVLDDDDATLGRLDVSEGEQMYFNVELALREGGAGIAPDAVPRDTYATSDDAAFPRLGELVVVSGFGASTSLDDEW